mgnify:CR=1 FL=1
MALLESPSLENPIARNEDRIDKVASDNKEVDTISDSAASEQSDQTKEPEDESVTEDKVAIPDTLRLPALVLPATSNLAAGIADPIPVFESDVCVNLSP